MLTALAVVLATTLELLVGEPPGRVHPVAHLGRAVAPVDRAWKRPRAVGVAIALAVPLAVAGSVGALVFAASLVDPRWAAVAAGVVLFVATSLRMLVGEARSVVALSVDDPDSARAALPALVGRDPSALSPSEVRSAAVESAAENLADGLVAPLAAFVLGAATLRPAGVGFALAAGAAAGASVKAVNTLDSMLGYRSVPVGWAPARLDDLVMWVPARVSALLLAAASGRPDAVLTARPWQDRVASPNAGWPMGTLAAAAGLRLEKPGAYVLGPDADLPSPAAAAAAVRTVAIAGGLAYVLAVVGLVAGEVVLWS